MKGKLEVADDLVNDRMIFDEGDDAHLASTGGIRPFFQECKQKLTEMILS